MPIARLAEERQKRNKYLQQKVDETLALAPPDQPALLKPFQNATYPLSADEEKASVRQYQEKLRLNRMLQVRAQEMLFASQRVEEFRDRKVKGNKKLLNHLKEVWREDQRRRIASLEDEFANACQSIGLSHDAAVLVERNRAAKEKLLGRRAEESRCWDILRFEEAMQKERELKEMRETVDKAPTVRRRIVESVSNIERSLARRYTPGSKPRTVEKIACCQSVFPPVSHDVEHDNIYKRLAGYPTDFKDTFLHCRYSVLRDRTNRPSSAVVNCPHRDEVDAWRAADAERESNRRKRERQAELDRLYNERKLERGNAAAAKLLNDQGFPILPPKTLESKSLTRSTLQRIALLEQEVEEALKEEERQKDRIHAAQLLCRRPISADHDKRPLYTKHKISYPLSCPGSMIEESTIEKETSSNKHNMAVQSERRLESVEGHCVAILEELPERSSTKSPVEGSGYRKLESVVDMPQEQGSICPKKPDFACINLDDVKMEVRTTDADVVVNNPIQQSVADDGADMTDLKTGPFFSKSSHQSVGPAHHPTGCSESPSRISYERVNEYVPAGIERNIPRLSHIESVRSGSLAKSREGAMDCPEEVTGLYHREIQSKSVTRSHNHTTDVGDRQRSQSEKKHQKPPFISSGSQGYKKIYTEPLFSSRSSLLIRSTDLSKAADNATPERASSVQSFNGSGRAGVSADRRSNFEVVKENGKEDVYRSNVCPPRGNFRLSSVTHMSVCSKAKKHVMETSRSWPFPGIPHPCLESLQMEGKVYGSGRGVCNKGNRQQQPHAESVLKWMRKSLGSPKSWDSRLRCNGDIRNEMYGGCFREMFYDSSRSRDDPSKKSECRERIHEPKMVRQRAAWKSYIDEPSVLKKQSNVVEKVEAAAQSVKSESSVPPFRNKRFSSTCSHQEDCQSVARLEQLPKVSQGRNCDTPATSVKSLPNLSAKRPRRHKVDGMSRKDPSLSQLGIQVDALENITTRIKTLSKRFHSPVQVSPDTVLRTSQKEISCLPTPRSSQKDHARKLEEFIKSPKRSNDVVSPSPCNALTNKEESTRNDTRARSACNFAEKILNARKTGNIDDDYTKTLKRARELPGESGSSRSAKINPERRYMKPWLSSSPSRRSPELATNYGNRNDAVPKERISFAPEMCDKTAITPFPIYNTLSQKFRTLANKSLMGQVKVTNKSPMMKSGVRSATQPSKRDPWEAQSLDFVLGSLADQVRELDERLRSATATSPILSSPSLKGSPHRGSMQMSDRPSCMSNLHYNLSKAAQLKDYNSLSSSVGSSPERRYRESNHSSPTAGRNFQDASAHVQKQSNNHPTSTTGGKPTAGMYMDDLKILLQEIDSGNLSPRRTAPNFSVNKQNPVSTAASCRDDLKDYVYDQSEVLYATDRYYPTKSQIKTGFEPQFASNISISPDSSTACSQESQRVQNDTRVVLVGKGKNLAVRDHVECGATGKVQVDHHKTSNVKSNLNRIRKARRTIKNRNRTSHQVIDNGHEDSRRIRKVKLSARSIPDENAHKGEDVLGKRSNDSRWVPKQTAERGHGGIRERLEKRTVEVRGCAPHQILHKGHTVVGELSAKGIMVEDSIDSLSPTNYRKSVRKGVDEGSAGTRWVTQEVVKVSRDSTAQKQSCLENQSPECAPSDGTSAPDGHVVIQGNLERTTAKRGWASPHVGCDGGHLVVLESLQRKTVKRVDNQAIDLAHPKKIASEQPESPLWGEDRSPHSPGDWRKHGLTLDEVEKRLLLSGSVDFSPWNTEKIPDILSQSILEDGSHRSKPPSPVPEAGPASWFHKNYRLNFRLSGSQNKSFQIPACKVGLRQEGPQTQYDSSNFDPSPAPSQDSVPVNASSVRRPVLQRLKRPNFAPKGGDALWALSGLSAPAERSRVPRSASADREHRENSSAPSNQRSFSRPKRESSSSHEEIPDAASKSSQDDNCLPVVMARDDESRREVIERRKKARQLDMEHRQRLCSRSSRPSSARNSA